LRALAHIQAKQDINLESIDDADVIAAHSEAGRVSVQVFFFRAGRNYGNRAYFPVHDRSLDTAEVLSAFLSQFYENKTPPKLVLLSHEPPEQALLSEALSTKAGYRVRLVRPRRGGKRDLVENARVNAREALARRMAESGTQRRLLE